MYELSQPLATLIDLKSGEAREVYQPPRVRKPNLTNSAKSTVSKPKPTVYLELIPKQVILYLQQSIVFSIGNLYNLV